MESAPNTFHYFELSYPPQRVVIKYRGETVADTKSAVLLKERYGKMLDPVYYLPRADIRMEKLEEMEATSYCPIKGETTKYSLKTDDGLVEHATWSYTEPTEEGEAIRDLMAFDLRKFTLELHPQ